MPDYQSFLSGQNLVDFWNNVKWLLFLVASIVLIFFSVDLIGLLIRVIRTGIVGEAEKNDPDDDDVYYY